MRNTTKNGDQSLPNDYYSEEAAVVPLQTYAQVAQTNGLFASQWYLSGIPFSRTLTSVQDVNVDGVWAEYDGSGVRIGVIDNFFDVDHPDLAGRFDPAASYDPKDPAGASDIRPDDKYGTHGTIVASTIGASADNGMGIVGVAYGATLVGFVTRLYSTAASARPELADLLQRQVDVDVSNNSWGFTTPFSDNFRLWTWVDYGAAFEHVAAEGRNGLGTVLVFAAGNDRQYVANDAAHDGDNTNYHNSTNSRFVLTVAATDETGHVTDFSTPGASLFIAAPGKNMLAARIADTDGNRANDYTYASGTSLAAPVITGVVALMLEANPELGYRDVQDILARSALRIDPHADSWIVNGATTWNGGGFLVSSDVGFGLVDAHAAVRLAETWTATQTHANEQVIAVDGTVTGSGALTDNVPLTFTFQAPAPADGFALQWVEVDVDITHTAVGDLQVVLVSPDGTESVLVDRPGAGNNTRANLQFTLSSDQFWGEDVAGDWRLVVTDAGTMGTGSITDWNVRFFGSQGHDDVYVFTDQFASLAGERTRILDSAGIDSINASPVTSNSTIDLAPGSLSAIAGRLLGISGSALIENAVGGDGDDHIVGNHVANALSGGRGDDVLTGGAGNDHLDGGQGADTAEFSGARADYSFFLDGSELVVRDDRAGAPDGVDHAAAVETLHFSDTTVMTADLLQRGLAAYVVEPSPADEPASGGDDTGGAGGSQDNSLTPPPDQSANDPMPPPSISSNVLFTYAPTGQALFAQMSHGHLAGWLAATNPLTSDWHAVGTGDTDRNGVDDVFFQNSQNGAIYVAMQDNAGLTGWAVAAYGMPSEWVLRGVADVTGDGYADALVQNTATGGIYAASMREGTFDGWHVVVGAMTSDWVMRGAGDINGDNVADVVVQNVTDGAIAWIDMAHGGFSAWNNVFDHFPTDWVARDVADFNGDRHADLLMQNTASGEAVFFDDLTNGGGHWVAVAGPIGSGWVARAASDVDGDGDADIVFQNDALGIAWYTEMTADGFKAWGVVAHAPEWLVA